MVLQAIFKIVDFGILKDFFDIFRLVPCNQQILRHQLHFFHGRLSATLLFTEIKRNGKTYWRSEDIKSVATVQA
jgi:hypothetical protein